MSDQTTVKMTMLGLGIMGSAIAGTAARRGLAVVGWDRTPQRAAALATDGIRAAEAAADAVADADVVVTMVPDADAVMSVMEGQARSPLCDRARAGCRCRRSGSRERSAPCVSPRRAARSRSSMRLSPAARPPQSKENS